MTKAGVSISDHGATFRDGRPKDLKESAAKHNTLSNPHGSKCSHKERKNKTTATNTTYITVVNAHQCNNIALILELSKR